MYYNIGIAVPIAVLTISIIVSYIFVMNLYKTENLMANNGLFFVSNAAKAHKLCQKASKFVQKVLYIKVNGSSESALPVMSREIVNIYSKSRSQFGKLDVRLILKSSEKVKNIKTNHPVDLIVYDSELSKEIDKLKQSVVNVKPECKLQKVDVENITQGTNVEPVKTYEYVALGGTFDRFHDGHKILLSQAVLRTTKYLAVGVTDVNMIQTKKLWELIQPVEQRMNAVLNFLTDINPNLEYNVLPIQDLYGPTKDDPRFQLLVVSEETIRGPTKINEKRKEKGLPPVDSYVIDLAHDSHPEHNDEEEKKISSTNQRMRLLGTLLRSPAPNPNIPDWPYVIGLAGGIASGKSNIAEKLKLKGAAIVNCDIIAHELYKPGLPLNHTLAATFGKHVITETGVVDRKQLGQIVFSNKEELEKLNQIIWPAILEEAQKRIKELGKQGYKVVVMEAAVMVHAKWYKYCHQLWSVIIPPEEAIKRLQKRNNLREEEARQRIESQISNIEQISVANIVFSPFWSYDHTQAQIDRAWDHLQEYLNSRK